MAQFKKGRMKTGGRKAGTPNTVNRENVRRLVAMMEEQERVGKELAALHGKDYFRTYLDALGLLLPKYSNIEFNGNIKVANEVAEKMREAIEE